MENAKKILKCWPLHVTLLVVVVACEWINTIKIPTPVGNILLLPMLYAIVITLVLSLQKPIKWMKQEASEVSSDFVACLPGSVATLVLPSTLTPNAFVTYS